MRITGIRQHPRRDRARIYVDGQEQPRTELALDLILQHGLAPGDTLTDSQLEALEREDDGYRARDAAMSLLAHRARSRAELRRRLDGKEFPAAIVDQVLDWLDARGYIDDRAFAEAFVRDRLRLRPRGRIGLLQELRRKGVDEASAEAAIAGAMASEGVDEPALAFEAARAWVRKNGSTVRKAARSPEDRQKARRRLYGHLARRGFAPDAVRAAIERALAD